MKSSAFLSKYRRFSGLKPLGIYTFTNFFGKGVAFLMLPYFTHVLSKSDVGLISLFSAAILFLMPFMNLGVLQSASIDYFKLGKSEFKDNFTSGLLLPTAVLLISIIVLQVFGKYFTTTYSFPRQFVWLVPLAAYFSFLCQHLANLIRNRDDSTLYMKVALGRLMMEIMLAVVFISGFNLAWQGRVYGIIFSFVAFGLYAFYYFKKHNYLFGRIRATVIKSEIIFSLPIIIFQFSTFSMNYSDVFFLSHFTNDNNGLVGIYSIACVFASIIITLSSALIQYIHPKIFKVLSQPVVNYSSIKKYFILYLGVMSAVLLLLFAVVPVFYHYILPATYISGLKYFYLLCTGYYFWTIAYLFFTFLLYYKKKTKILLVSTVFIIISLLSNYLFISTSSAKGAAISVFVVYLVVLIISVAVSYKGMRFIFQSDDTRR